MQRITFPIAPMSTDIRIATTLLLLLPVGVAVAAFTTDPRLALLAGIFSLLYAAVWLLGRPAAFIVDADAVEIVWPLRRRRIPRRAIVSARVMDRDGLKQETGAAVRVGAGGLWGGFGWLWSQRRGWVHLYLSSTSGMVWLECADGRPWLISPATPQAFVDALASGASASQGDARAG